MQRIEISINGQPTRVSHASTVDSALRDCGYTLDSAAVAINETVVPRAHYATQLLQHGDRIEVLTPFAGG